MDVSSINWYWLISAGISSLVLGLICGSIHRTIDKVFNDSMG